MLTEREIVVLTGVHAGARLPISEATRTLGRAEECSVVLTDDDLDPVHLLLAPSGRGIAVTAVGLVRADADETAWAKGASRVIDQDTVLRVGDTRLMIRVGAIATTAAPGDDTKVLRRAMLRRRRRVLPVSAAATVGVLVAGLSWWDGAPAPKARASTMPIAAPIRLPPMRSLLSFATAAVAAAGLPSVAFAAGSDGTVIATGAIVPAEAARWQSVRDAIDGRFDGQVVLLDQVATNGDLPDLKVSAVWLGTDPYVTIDDGEEFHRGAILPGGWNLESIVAGSLLIRRGDHVLRVRY